MSQEKPLSNERGAILIVFITGMVLIAVMGAAIVSMYSTSTMSQIGGVSSLQAYYLAESGGRYAKLVIANGVPAEIAALGNTNFTVGNGQFVLTEVGGGYGNADEYMFSSTGIVGDVSRVITYQKQGIGSLITAPGSGGTGGPGSINIDDAFDGDTSSAGYASSTRGAGPVSSVNQTPRTAYIQYEFSSPQNVTEMRIFQPAKKFTMASIIVEYWDGTDWIQAGNPITLGYNNLDVTFDITGGAPSTIWRVIPDSPTRGSSLGGGYGGCNSDGGCPWKIDELQMTGTPPELQW